MLAFGQRRTTQRVFLTRVSPWTCFQTVDS